MSQFKNYSNKSILNESISLEPIEKLVEELSKPKPNDKILKQLSDQCRLPYSKNHISMMASVLDVLDQHRFKPVKVVEV